MSTKKSDIRKPQYPLHGDRAKKVNYQGLHCPICELSRTAILQVNRDIHDAIPPMEILFRLKRVGFIPRDHHNEIIATESSWSNSIRFHLYQCLNEHPEDYESAWKSAESDRRLHAELSKRLASESSSGSYMADDFVKPVAESKTIDKGSLIKQVSGSLPSILANHMRILEMEQQRYLRGEIENAPLNDLKTIDSLMRSLSQMVGGKFGVQGIFDKNE